MTVLNIKIFNTKFTQTFKGQYNDLEGDCVYKRADLIFISSLND